MKAGEKLMVTSSLQLHLSYKERAIVLYGDWHKGVLGIAASKLVEKFNRPVILFTKNGEELSGSCRSIPGVNIYETLSLFKDYFLRFGGHSQAAGVTMHAEKFDEFTTKFYSYLKTLPENCFDKKYEYDADITNKVISDKFLEELNKRIKTSTFVKKNVTSKVIDATNTYVK